MLEEKLCGSCSKIKNLSLEDRIIIANSVVLGNGYLCPECSSMFTNNGSKYVKYKEEEIH